MSIYIRRITAVMLTALLLVITVSCGRNDDPEQETRDETVTDTDSTEPEKNTETVFETENKKKEVKKMIFGVDCRDAADINSTTVYYLKKARINCVKFYVPYPFANDGSEELAPAYTAVKEKIVLLASEGIGVMAQTFIPGSNSYNSKTGRVEFSYMVPGATAFDSKFYGGCLRGCKFMAEDLGKYVDRWLISNELNAGTFSGAMTAKQIVDFVSVCADAIRDVNKDAVCGVNLFAAAPNCKSFAQSLFSSVKLDFIGLDGYFGTLSGGSPDTWKEYIAEYSELVDVPIVITEFSYSTAVYNGKDYKPDPAKAYNTDICKYKKFQFDWEGHERTKDTQSEYLTECLKIFDESENVDGCFWWCLKDYAGACFECGDKNCPMDAGWGLLTAGNGIKPSLNAYSDYIAARGK